MVWTGMPSSARAARMTSSSPGVCGLSVSSIETSVMNPPSPFARLDVPVDAARVPDRPQVLPSDSFQIGPGHVKWGFDAGDRQPSNQIGMAVGESRRPGGVGRLTDGVRHVNGVEVTGIEKAVHGLQADVVSVHMVGAASTQAPARRRPPPPGRSPASTRWWCVPGETCSRPGRSQHPVPPPFGRPVVGLWPGVRSGPRRRTSIFLIPAYKR